MKPALFTLRRFCFKGAFSFSLIREHFEKFEIQYGLYQAGFELTYKNGGPNTKKQQAK